MNRRRLIGATMLSLVLTVSNVPMVTVRATEDTSVSNKADFSTDVVYQIVTDRFVDGDSSNNPQGEIFNKSDNRKYHGGDWAGITQKINDGYFTDMGISALWISSPVENIMSIDPSNKTASYHGYWGKDFFRTNPAFGTMNDFKNLIKTAHSKNIKIIIDFAPNHTSTAEFAGMNFPEDGALYRDGNLVGKFSDELGGILKGQSISVNSKGEVNGLRLEGGEYDISVETTKGTKAKYSSFRVLSSKQVATRFYVNNANTQYGSSVYIVGNVEELGNWDVNKAVGPFFNNTKSIANYPTWFYDISLPSLNVGTLVKLYSPEEVNLYLIVVSLLPIVEAIIPPPLY